MNISQTESKSNRTRSRILHAAAKTFRQHGYASSSLREIADVAEMQAGSLYYHFESKDELAEAVMDAGVTQACQHAEAGVAALGDAANPLDCIAAAFRGHLNYLLQESDFAVATLRMLHQTPEAIRIRHTHKQRAFGRFYASLFERAQREGFIRPEFNLSALRMLLLGALNWSPEWFDDSGLSPDELVDQLNQMMQCGITPDKLAAFKNRDSARRRVQ